MLYYRIKYGYGKDEFYSVDETELPKAIRAQINGTVAIFNEGTIAGNSIMAIMPDLNRAMGYNRDYQLTGEDYAEIGQKRQDEHRLFLENAKMAIAGKTQTEKPREINSGVKQLAEKMSVDRVISPQERAGISEDVAREERKIA